MKKILCLCLPLLLCAFQAKNTSRDQALEDLANAERAFSAASVKKGIKAAFVEYLADDGLVFMPGPVNGKEAYGKMPGSNARLSWYPAFADISGSLDWGYTTGPYELRPGPEAGKPTGAGFYLSVWEKQPDGQWKVAVDLGNSFPPELIRQEAYQPVLETAGREAAKGAEAELLAADVQQAQPYAPQTLIYRHGQYPYRYHTAAPEPAGDIVYSTLGHDISPAADMAYTYGSYTQSGGEEAQAGYYLKVWKVLDGEWRLVAHNLVPAQK